MTIDASRSALGHQSFVRRAVGDDDGRIRVVHCLDSLEVGGTELNAVRTLERLDRTRFDPVVACLRQVGPLGARLAASGIPVIEFPISGLIASSAIREGVRFARFLTRHRVHVVHSHDQYNNFFACLSARSVGVPLVIASRRWSVTQMRRRHRAANFVGLRFAHVVLANSSAVAHELVTHDRISAHRVVTISNYVDDEAFEDLAPAARTAALRELGIPEPSPVLGIVARLDPIKDHATLLRAFVVLAAEFPSLRLLIVGDGSERPRLEAQATSLGVRERVHFAGMRPHSPNLQGLFDVSVLPSLSEGFPNSVIEAMAAARPVVATAVGGTVDAVIEGTTGLLVRPGDAEAMARAVASLLTDPQRAAALGAAGRRRARAEYQAASVLPRLERLYATALRPRGHSADA